MRDLPVRFIAVGGLIALSTIILAGLLASAPPAHAPPDLAAPQPTPPGRKPAVLLDEGTYPQLPGQPLLRLRYGQPGCGELLLRLGPQDLHLDQMTAEGRRALAVQMLRQPCKDGDQW